MFSLLRLDPKQSIISLSDFRSFSGSEDELSEIFLTNKIFRMLLEGTTPNSVVPPVIVVGKNTLLRQDGLDYIGVASGASPKANLQ